MRSLLLIILAMMTVSCSTSSEVDKSPAEHAIAAEQRHGLVGLRPLPRSRAEALAVAGEAGKDIPLYDHSIKGQYPVVAERLDALYGGFDGDEFKAKKIFIEYYWGISEHFDNLDPTKSPLVKDIASWEAQGYEMEHILICREYRLAIERGYPDATPGPFKEDTRILFLEDVQKIRAMFKQAYGMGILKYDDYKLILMVEHPSFFAEDERVWPLISAMEGVAYEAHQFNRHWPLEKGWSKPAPVIKGAQWTLAKGKEYIFYYGPIVWKHKDYTPFVEREWLETYWKAGLPKHDPRMHYYLNLFPHAHGCGRPVGPESDPHSKLGFTKWVIEEIKGRDE